jgi:hypothetical protein
MVNNRIRYHAYTALALLLADGGLVNADVYVCGNDYGDAVANCVINTACPNGAGCSTEQTCFAIPDDECIGMTTSPSPSVMPPLYVCGISYEDALSRCNSPSDACTNVTNTSAYCASTEDEDAFARSCFIIPHETCPTIAPSNAPVSGSVAATATTSPTVTAVSASVSPTASVVSKAPTIPTISPTPEYISVCGEDYADASDNFCTLTNCPTGDVSSFARDQSSRRGEPLLSSSP